MQNEEPFIYSSTTWIQKLEAKGIEGMTEINAGGKVMEFFPRILTRVKTASGNGAKRKRPGK